LAGDGVLPGRRFCELVPIHKWSICPISALREKFNPRNINHMPAAKFSARVPYLDPICLFVDGHELLFSDIEAQIVVK
jgi:hypothetical protein